MFIKDFLRIKFWGEKTCKLLYRLEKPNSDFFGNYKELDRLFMIKFMYFHVANQWKFYKELISSREYGQPPQYPTFIKLQFLKDYTKGNYTFI